MTSRSSCTPSNDPERVVSAAGMVQEDIGGSRRLGLCRGQQACGRGGPVPQRGLRPQSQASSSRPCLRLRSSRSCCDGPARARLTTSQPGRRTGRWGWHQAPLTSRRVAFLASGASGGWLLVRKLARRKLRVNPYGGYSSAEATFAPPWRETGLTNRGLRRPHQVDRWIVRQLDDRCYGPESTAGGLQVL